MKLDYTTRARIVALKHPLLSDIDSKVIKQFGILNEQVTKNDALLSGIPYPGVYVTDEAGTVVAKFFHDSYKKRDSPELYIDAAIGRLNLDENAPQVTGSNHSVAHQPHASFVAPVLHHQWTVAH